MPWCPVSKERKIHKDIKCLICSLANIQSTKEQHKGIKILTEKRASPCSNWALLWPRSAARFIHFLASWWLLASPSPKEKHKEILYIARTYPPSAAFIYHLACSRKNLLKPKITTHHNNNRTKNTQYHKPTLKPRTKQISHPLTHTHAPLKEKVHYFTQN